MSDEQTRSAQQRCNDGGTHAYQCVLCGRNYESQAIPPQPADSAAAEPEIDLEVVRLICETFREKGRFHWQHWTSETMLYALQQIAAMRAKLQTAEDAVAALQGEVASLRPFADAEQARLATQVQQ